MKGPAESKPSSFEAVFAAYAVVATFVLGYGYWRLATRQNEQDAKIEQQRQEQQAALSRLQREADDKRAADDLEIQVISLASPHLAKLTQSGREAATSQRIVAAAAGFLSSKGRPALAQMVEKIRAEAAPIARSQPRIALEQPAASVAPPSAWLVLLATLSGDELKLAEGVANEKLRAAKDLETAPVVSIYKTRLKGRYVVVLGQPAARSAALAAAAAARRGNLAADAFAEPDDGWELIGRAPFPSDIRSASSN
jgi:hypothetical protein